MARAASQARLEGRRVQGGSDRTMEPAGPASPPDAAPRNAGRLDRRTRTARAARIVIRPAQAEGSAGPMRAEPEWWTLRIRGVRSRCPTLMSGAAGLAVAGLLTLGLPATAGASTRIVSDPESAQGELVNNASLWAEVAGQITFSTAHQGDRIVALTVPPAHRCPRRPPAGAHNDRGASAAAQSIPVLADGETEQFSLTPTRQAGRPQQRHARVRLPAANRRRTGPRLQAPDGRPVSIRYRAQPRCTEREEQPRQQWQPAASDRGGPRRDRDRGYCAKAHPSRPPAPHGADHATRRDPVGHRGEDRHMADLAAQRRPSNRGPGERHGTSAQTRQLLQTRDRAVRHPRRSVHDHPSPHGGLVVRDLLRREGTVTTVRPSWSRSSNTADLYLQAGEWMLFILVKDPMAPMAVHLRHRRQRPGRQHLGKRATARLHSHSTQRPALGYRLLRV